MEFSRKFAEQVGLISERMRKIMRAADRKGIPCSMPMIGESVFSLIKRDTVEELLKIFHKHAPSGHSILVAGIDFKGARIL
jgi:pantoate kinase